MEQLVEEAFRMALHTEMKSYWTYLNAAGMMPEGNCKKIMERLASEQWKIIEEISNHSPLSIRKSLEQAEHHNRHCFHPYPKESHERKLYKHLQTALVDKHCSIEKYMIFVTTFRDPAVCNVFEMALNMSHKLFGYIAEVFRQTDVRLHRPGVDRRKKRIHLKPISRSAPNKHTELFVSLLDSGRKTLS